MRSPRSAPPDTTERRAALEQRRLLADAARLRTLGALRILDTPAETEYDDLATLAAAVCHSPVGAVNFVDDRRHFTKAIAGLPEALGGSVANELSFCAATIASDTGILVVPDTSADERWQANPLVTGGPRVGFYAGASIESNGQRVGVVCVFGDRPRDVTDGDRAGLAALGRQATELLELRRRNAELRDLALTDPLTGLANRTLLLERLQAAMADRRRAGGEIGVVFCDVDDFKAVNDRFGHEAGDRLLCRIAECLRGAVRAGDTVARIAGDEFVLVCPDVTEADFAAITARAAALSCPDVSVEDRDRVRLSIGAVLAREGEEPAHAVSRADVAMYASKFAKSPAHA